MANHMISNDIHTIIYIWLSHVIDYLIVTVWHSYEITMPLLCSSLKQKTTALPGTRCHRWVQALPQAWRRHFLKFLSINKWSLSPTLSANVGHIWWYLIFSHIISLKIITYSCNFGVLWPVPSSSSSHGTPRSVWISMDTPVFVVFFFLHSFPAFSSNLQLQCWHGKATIPSAWFVLRFPGSFVSLKPAECSKPPMCCMAWRIGWHL